MQRSLCTREMLQRLLGGGKAFTSVDDFQMALKETHYLPTEVDPSLRLGQLTVQAATLSLGLALMFGISGLFAVFNILARETNIYRAEQIIAMLDSKDGRKQLHSDPKIASAVSDPEDFRDRLQCYIALQQSEADRMDPALTPSNGGCWPNGRPHQKK